MSEPVRKNAIGKHMLCPDCTARDLIAGQGVELQAENPDSHLCLIPIRQTIRNEGARSRLLFYCGNCGKGVQMLVTIHNELRVQVDLDKITKAGE